MPADSQCFTILQSVDSTNNYAMAQAHAGLAKAGDVYFALEQTAGKGQRGKSWNSNHSDNVMMSLVVEPARIPGMSQFSLSALVAVCCAGLVSAQLSQPATIKWPNDIYVGDRKAGGILIENILQGQEWRFAIVGIGINVNQTRFPPHLHNPVSLRQVSGVHLDVVDLAKQLAGVICANLPLLNPAEIILEYNRLLYKRQEMVSLKKDNIVFQAQILRVTAEGSLVVRHAIEQEFVWGEIEWKLPMSNF